MKTLLRCSIALHACICLAACGGNNSSQTGGGGGGSGGAGGSSTGGAGGGTKSPFDKFYNVESLSYEGDQVVITTKDLPDHKSPFYPMNSPMYEAYNGTNPSFS